jgi:putative transposase
MTKKRHKSEEIILLLRECDASDLSQESFCQKKQISVATLHLWRKKYGMMDVADAKQLKALEKENGELKKMYADAMLSIKVLQEALEKKL